MPNEGHSEIARRATAPWLKIALVLMPAAFLMQLDKQVMVVLSPVIQQEFRLDLQELARVLAAMAWAYALFQIPGAWLARRLGPMRTIGLCVTAWSIAVLMTPLAAGPVGLIVLRALMGALQAPDMLSSLMIIQREVPLRLRSRGSAALFGGGYLGTVVSGPVAVSIASQWGWRACFQAFGGVGLLFGLAILAYSFVSQTSSIGGGKTTRDASLRETLRLPRVHALGSVYLFFSVVQSFVYVLLPVYLTTVRHTSLVQAGWLASAPFVALYLAVVTGGVLSDAILRRTGSILLARVPLGGGAMILAGTCFFAGMAMTSTSALMMFVCAGMAFVGVGQVVMWTAVQDASSGVGGYVAAWVQVSGAVGLGLGSVTAAHLVAIFDDWYVVGLLLFVSGIAAAAGLWIARPHIPLVERGETSRIKSDTQPKRF